MKEKIQKKQSWIKFLLKIFILSWLTYALFFVACDETKSDSCPLPNDLRFESIKLAIGKIPFLENINIDISPEIEKISNILKSHPVGSKFLEILNDFTSYYHDSAIIFVNDITPVLANYLNQALEKLEKVWTCIIDTGVPFVRRYVAIGAKSLRQIFNDYYPTKLVQDLKILTLEKFSSGLSMIYNTQIFQDISKSEIYKNFKENTLDLRISFSKYVNLWFFEYPMTGFDLFWRLLEDNISSQEYEKFYSVMSEYIG